MLLDRLRQWLLQQSLAPGLATGWTWALLLAGSLIVIDSIAPLSRAGRTLGLIVWLLSSGLLFWRAFRRASEPLAQSKPSVWLAVGLLGLALLVLAVVPGAGQRVRRFVSPWQDSPTDLLVTIRVPSGHATVARGESVTLVGYLDGPAGRSVAPAELQLIVRPSAQAQETRFSMNRDESAVHWHTRREVRDDFDYCVEVGQQRSEWYRIAVSDPVNLQDSTRILVRPPSYAEAQLSSQTEWPWADLQALAYSRLQLTLRFDRPVEAVQLDWSLLERETQSIAVKLDPDRRAAAATLEVRQSGVLRLQLIGERNLRRDYTATVRVLPDQPPAFEKVVGLNLTQQEARPDDRVLLELAARDDLQINKVWVEYFTGADEGRLRTELLRLPGVGTSRVEGTVLFSLEGKAREGEILHYRLVLADHRQLLSQHLGPQEVRFPATGWASLRLNRSARSLAEQEITGHRSRIRDRLTVVSQTLQTAQGQLRGLRQESLGDGPVSLDQAVRIRECAEQIQQATTHLRELSQELDVLPDFRGFASDLQKVVDQVIRPAGQQLRQAEASSSSLAKARSLQQASDTLVTSQLRVQEFEQRNDRLADVRAALRGLRELASDQRDLAEDCTRAGSISIDELERRQRDLNARLAAILTRQPVLARVVREAGQHEVRQGFTQMGHWLENQWRLDMARQATEASYRSLQLRELYQSQLSLGQLAEQLSRQSATAARVAGSAPLNLGPFELAQELFPSGEPNAALAEQEKAIRELSRLAQELRRGVEVRTEMREAVRQVARWQDDLRRRYSDRLHHDPTDASQRFSAEQQLIHDTLKSLKLVEVGAAYQQAYQAAIHELDQCVRQLQSTSASTASTMIRATELLRQLTELTPTQTERLKAAKPRLDQLRKDQEALRGEIEQARLRRDQDPGDEQLLRLGMKQTQLLERLERLDVPSLEPHRARTLHLASCAADDLRRAYVEDLSVSQMLLRKQLEKLRQALDGHPLPEEQLSELLPRQQQFQAIVLQAVRLVPDQVLDWEREQRERLRTLSRISDRDAPMAWAELRAAGESLDQALRQADSLPTIQDAAQHFLTRLEVLTNRLNGAESDQDRVTRLLRERQAEHIASQKPRKESVTATQESVRRADQQLEELRQLRVGPAFPAKARAIEALLNLRQANQPDRRPLLQQAAVEQLEQLQRALATQPERAIPWRDQLVPELSEKLRLESLPTDGKLPHADRVVLIDQLRVQQQLLRDRTAIRVTELNRGIPLAMEDEWLTWANEQADLVREFVQATDGQAIPEGHLAVAFLRCGYYPEAQAQARLLAATWASYPEFAQRHHELWQKIRPHWGSLALRQSQRQQELLHELQQLALEFRRLAIHRGGMFNEQLLNLARQLESLSEKFQQAARERKAGRANFAIASEREARTASEELARQIRQIQMGWPTPPSGGDQSWLAGVAFLTALDAMQQVSAKLIQANGKQLAGEAMQMAADALSRSAQRLQTELTSR